MKSDLELAIALRKKWGVGVYEPLDIFPVVLSNFPNLSILIHPMSDDISGFCINEENIQIIGINSKYPKNFTLACEVYKLLFGNGNADCFASFLLMTDEGLKRYIKINKIDSWNLDNMHACEQYFHITHQMLLSRLNKLGFSLDEYDISFKDDLFCVLGNYHKMINHVDKLGGLTEGKKRELLLDGGRADLVFNKQTKSW